MAKLEILPFPESALSSALARIYGENKFTQTDFQLCATASGGSLGTAQTMLEGGEYKTLIDEAFSLCLCTGKTLPPLVRKTGETKRKKELLFLLRTIFRDALLVKTLPSKKDALLLKPKADELTAVAEKYRAEALIYAQEEISKAEKQVFFNAYFPQCLEVLISNILFFNAKQAKKNQN